MSEKQRNRLEELLQQEVPAHGGEPFISEPDLRALPAFKKGEVSGYWPTGRELHLQYSGDRAGTYR